MKLLVFLVTVIIVASAAEDLTIVFDDSSFTDGLKTHGDIFVIFNKEKNHQVEDFYSFYTKVAKLYNSDANATIRFAKVDCEDAPKTCQSQNIDQSLTLKLYASKKTEGDWKVMNDYITNVLKESLDELAVLEQMKDGKIFVAFTVPYCPNCNTFFPVWEDLEVKYKNSTDVTIMQIDCKEQRKICIHYKVEKYPWMLWLENGAVIERYEGLRNMDELGPYVTKMAARRIARSLPDGDSPVIIFKGDFKKSIESGLSFFLFQMDQCPYCQNPKALWGPLAQKHASDKIKFYKVECMQHAPLCFEEANGSPTLNVYQNGVRLQKDYHEVEDEDGLNAWVTAYTLGGEALTKWKAEMKVHKKARKAKEAEEEAKCGVNGCGHH